MWSQNMWSQNVWFQWKKFQWKKLVTTTFVLMLLSGCGPATGWILAGGAAVTAGSLMMTKKLPSDIVAERQTGLECDTINGLKNNTEICRAKYDDRIPKPNVGYCYRSIGSIVCYDRPDPSYVEVGRERHKK